MKELEIQHQADPTVPIPYDGITHKRVPKTWKKKTYAEAASEKTVYFKGPDHPLSNLYPCELWIDGYEFHSSEGAYQFFKAMTMAENSTSKWDKGDYWNKAKKIQETKNPWNAMDMGQFNTDDKWKHIKIDVMRAILLEKYTQCKKYQEYLDKSGKSRLIENTTHHFWGGKQENGLNMLGLLHQWIRDDSDKNNLQPYTQQVPGNSRTYSVKNSLTTNH